MASIYAPNQLIVEYTYGKQKEFETQSQSSCVIL